MKKPREKERVKKQEKASRRDVYADAKDKKEPEPEKETKKLEKSKQGIEDITEEIRKLAYQFFLDRNYQDGRDFDDWLAAERTIKLTRQSGQKSKS